MGYSPETETKSERDNERLGGECGHGDSWEAKPNYVNITNGDCFAAWFCIFVYPARNTRKTWKMVLFTKNKCQLNSLRKWKYFSFFANFGTYLWWMLPRLGNNDWQAFKRSMMFQNEFLASKELELTILQGAQSFPFFCISPFLENFSFFSPILKNLPLFSLKIQYLNYAGKLSSHASVRKD